MPGSKFLVGFIAVVATVSPTVPPASAAGPRTWFVAPAGSGGGSCLTPDATTISEAIEASGTGDTIEVCPGEYRELIRVAGHRHDGLTLRSMVPHEARIRPPELDATFSHSLVVIGSFVNATDGADRVTVAGFDLGAGSPAGCVSTVVAVTGGTGTRVEGNRIHASPGARAGEDCFPETAIETWGASVRISGNIIEDPGATGIRTTAESEQSVAVTGNIIRCCGYPRGLEPPDPDDAPTEPDDEDLCGYGPTAITVSIDRRGRVLVRGNLVEGRVAPAIASGGIPPWCVGIAVSSWRKTPGLVVDRNVVRDGAVGLDVAWDTAGATIAGNDVTATRVACRDQRAAETGRAPRNTWQGDIGTTGPGGTLSEPGGLCLARPDPVARASVVPAVAADGTTGADGSCDGTRRAFRRIQAAIDASRPGDTVRVCPGVYTGALEVEVDDLSLVAAEADHAPILRASRGVPGSALALLDTDPPTSLVRVAARRVTIAGFLLRPHGGEGRCRGLVRRGEGALLRVWGGGSVTVRDTVFTATTGSRACSAYDHAVLGMADGPPIAIRLEQVTIRDFDATGVSLTEFGHGEPNELVITGSRFSIARQPRGAWGEPGRAVDFSGSRILVIDTAVEAAPGVVVDGIRVNGGEFVSTEAVILRNRLTGVTTGVVLDGVGSGEVSGNVLMGSGQAGEGIRVSGDPVVVRDNVVSGVGGPGLVAGAWFVDEEELIAPHAFTGNDARGNAGTDCVDGSAGPAEPTEPTEAELLPAPYSGSPPWQGPVAASPSPAPSMPLLATWSDNRGDESVPDGLCLP